MYIRERRVLALKIKNVLFIIFGIFFVASSVAVMISLISYYSDQLETVLHAKATPECIVNIIIGCILLLIACVSRKQIGDSNFYSSYFEGDLSGYIKYADLADVTGRSEQVIRKQMQFYRSMYMKGYELQVVDGEEQIALDSKTCLCECKNCGAEIEKRIYFTGKCSYCGSSDLSAKVVTDHRFYHISNHVSEGVAKPQFYTKKNLMGTKTLSLCWLCLGISVVCIAAIACLDNLANYSNEEYLTKVLLSGKSYSSFELIKADIMDTIIWCLVLMIALLPVVFSRGKKLTYINTADCCSKFFAKCTTPFVHTSNLPAFRAKNRMCAVRGALRKRYLLNCTLEKHDGALQVVLAKRIVKDKCPYCSAPITGAVDEKYQCGYCGNTIMGVIRKK